MNRGESRQARDPVTLAAARGETEQRLYALNAWREAPFYSDRERAALEWTEAITRVADMHVPDEVFTRVRVHFDEPQLMLMAGRRSACGRSRSRP